VPGESAPVGPALRSAEDWARLVAGAKLDGLALELARHCALQGWDGQRLSLALNPAHLHLRVAGAEERLRGALSKALGANLRLEIGALEITAASDAPQTPAQRQAREQAQELAEAERLLQTDPIARQLRERFDAEWIPGTLTPLRSEQQRAAGGLSGER
jgi:DNA polymerase-3 subunit gamma/tau